MEIKAFFSRIADFLRPKYFQTMSNPPPRNFRHMPAIFLVVVHDDDNIFYHIIQNFFELLKILGMCREISDFGLEFFCMWR